MKRPQFVTGEIYHLLNRGVEKRRIFSSEKDYFRFIHDLYEFNDELPAENIFYKFSALKSYEVRLRKAKRKNLVEILAYCLMPNHFHLLVRQVQDKGITEFMRKLGTGYTNYFNLKYKRVGPLFQGKFKAVLVEHEKHFIYLPFYIHLNPLDLVEGGWREKRLSNLKNAVRFLDTYRWSSYLDYIGKRNFPSVIHKGLLSEFFEGPQNYKKTVLEWLKERNINEIKDVILE